MVVELEEANANRLSDAPPGEAFTPGAVSLQTIAEGFARSLMVTLAVAFYLHQTSSFMQGPGINGCVQGRDKTKRRITTRWTTRGRYDPLVRSSPRMENR